MKEDGSARERLLPDSIVEFDPDAISLDGRWVVTYRADSGVPNVSLGKEAFPIGGGSPVTICSGGCSAGWAPGGQTFYVSPGTMQGGKTLIVPISPGQDLPPLPAAGIQTEADMASVKGGKVMEGVITPGPTPGLYAFARRSVHRNLYSIPLH